MRLPVAILAALACLPVQAGEDDFGRVLDRVKKQLEQSDLDHRAGAYRLLDPGDARSLPVLREGLNAAHWLQRGAAAEVLSKVTNPALRAELRLDLITHQDAQVREGMALAFALSPEKGDAEALSDALQDGDLRVRECAARALAGIVSKDSLAALVASLRSESESRVAAVIADTLRRLTGRNLGRDPEAWRKWWDRNKDSAALEGLDEEVKKRELGGIPLETVTVAGRRDGGGRDRPEILVLAPFGWTHDYYRPYLDDLTRFSRVTYVKLPRISEVTRSSGYGPAAPAYPVGSLVKALEALRRELGPERVIVFAEGATGWIAERYAVEHPKSAAALVILNGFLDSASYAAALGRFARSPNSAERWTAQTLMNRNAVPHDKPAYDRISRVALTADLMDPTDARGYLLWRAARDPQGFATVPDLRFNDRSRMTVPTVFLFGGQHRLSGFPEAARIRKHFPKNVIAVMHKSRGFPFASEYDEFYRVIEGFFTYYNLL